MKRHASLAERFWSRVRKDEEHWLWTGYRDKDGYGNIAIYNDDPISCRRPDGKPSARQAHRVSYEMANGPIPDDQQVLHANSCNTPSCVRPDHLYLGTPQRNMDDREEIKHTSWGEHRPAHKLTEDDVRSIRSEYGPRGVGGLSIPKLATKYGVDNALIHRIIRRKAWTRVQ